MKENAKDALKTVVAGGIGAAAGVGAHGVIGSIGIAVGGTAVGVTLGPFMAIGAGVGAASYGFYWLGKQIQKSKSKK